MSGIGSWTEQRQFHPIQSWATTRPDHHAAGGQPSQGWPIKLILLPISPLGQSDGGWAPHPPFSAAICYSRRRSHGSVPAWRTVPVVVVVVVSGSVDDQARWCASRAGTVVLTLPSLPRCLLPRYSHGRLQGRAPARPSQRSDKGQRLCTLHAQTHCVW